LLLAGSAMAAAAAGSQPVLPGDIASQPLPAALEAFSAMTGLQIVYRSSLTRQRTSDACTAGMGRDACLDLLLRGSGLHFRFLNERTVAIIAGTGVEAADGRASSSSGVRAGVAARDAVDGNEPTASVAQSRGKGLLARLRAGLFPEPRPGAAAETGPPPTVPASAVAGLEEVTVTATKAGQREPARIPMAIQAFSGSALESTRVNELADLMEMIPGAAQQSQVGSAFRIFSLRGSGAAGSVGDGMIGYYLDDSPFAVPNFQNAPPLQYFDLDRVEVLRGPQGTLYGQGSMGGTIIYHLRAPDLARLTLDGEAGVSQSTDAGGLNYRMAGALSVPLVAGTLGVRLSAGRDVRAGYADVYAGAPAGVPSRRDANDVANSDVRFDALWQPSPALRLRLQAWQFTTSQDYLQVMGSLRPPYLAYQGGYPAYERARTNFYSATLSYDLGAAVLTEAASYQDTQPSGFGTSVTDPSRGTGILVNGYSARGVINELRVASKEGGRGHWVAGAFFQDAASPYRYSIDAPWMQAEGSTRTSTQNGSLFGELSYDFLHGRLVPLVGVRYFQDHREAHSLSNGVPAASESNPRIGTWRINLSVLPSARWLAFLSAGTGFRSGLLQTQAQADAVTADGIASGTALRPDRLRSIEVGVKTETADGAVRLATSAYAIRYLDLQSSTNTSSGLTAFANLGDAETTGVDIDLAWRTPVRGLSFSVIGNVNSAHYANVDPAYVAGNPRASDGLRLYNTPPYNWRLEGTYSRVLGASGARLVANASLSTNGSARVQNAQVDSVPAYSLLAASIGISRGAFTWAAYGDNLGDERGPTTANSPTLLAGPNPRTFGIRVRASFH
jgi:outer membrane receptor protein involved in Fe transport